MSTVLTARLNDDIREEQDVYFPFQGLNPSMLINTKERKREQEFSK